MVFATACSSRQPAQTAATPAQSGEPRGEDGPAGAGPNNEESQADEGYGNLWGTDITEQSSGEEPEPRGGLGIVGGTVPTAARPANVGYLPKEEIQKVVRSAHPEVRKCYEAGLGRDAGLTGRVTVRFVIEPDGSVKNAGHDEEKTTLPDDDVVTCVVASMKNLRFPQPEGGRVFVVYPFRLEPEDGE